MSAEIDALVARAHDLHDRLMCQSVDSDAGNCEERNESRVHYCVTCTAEALADELERLAASRPAPAPAVGEAERCGAIAKIRGVPTLTCDRERDHDHGHEAYDPSGTRWGWTEDGWSGTFPEARRKAQE